MNVVIKTNLVLVRLTVPTCNTAGSQWKKRMRGIFMQSFFMIFLFFLCGIFLTSSVCIAQHRISNEIKEQLRNEGNYGRRSLPFVDYDFAAYKKVERIETPYGEFRSWDYPYKPNIGRFQVNDKYQLRLPYFTRMGGVKRGTTFSADSIGKIFRDHYVLWADGLGNTLYESLKISNKYGLNHYLYAPDYDPGREEPEGPQLPFTNAGIAKYKKEFPDELDYMLKFIDQIQPLYYKDFLDNSNQLWALFTGIDTSPLGLFFMATDRNYDQVNREFKKRYGFDLPLKYDSTKPGEVVHRIKLWEYVREQHGKVTHVRSSLFRKNVTDKGRLISNIHMGTQVNYEWYGKNFDHPGVGIRPMLLRNELVWKYYMGYGTRLIYDLTDRAPVISPRVNIPSGGARIVPTSKATKHWYSQAVRNGAVGFYDWLKDYPARENDETAYGGFSYDNPDPSAKAKERWNTILDAAKTTAQSYVFNPPSSQVGILVNIADANVEKGWFNIFSSYIELKQAGVWSTFISSTELRNQSESLDRYRVLIIPKIEYLYQTVADQIQTYVKNGGVILVTDPDAFSYNMNAENLSKYRQSILGIDSVEKYTGGNNKITFKRRYNPSSISPYNTPYKILSDTTGSVRPLAYYPNHSIAVTSNRVGKGNVIFAPRSLCDIYSPSNIHTTVDSGRVKFYKLLEKNHHIKDKRWVWDITIDNVHELTGSFNPNLPPVNHDILFRWYMNPFLP